MNHATLSPSVDSTPESSSDIRDIGLRNEALGDPARLAAVRATGLLDSEIEEVFDRLTRLAVRLLGIPAAFISLVDAERDFYKSACGFGEPLASARELSGPTFCHYTIQRTTPLVIPDTAADPVYRNVPTVRSLGVAAYVGVPLMVGGQAIGAFCAIDMKPRAWTRDEVDTLVELAASANREVELRGAVATTRAANASLERARAAAEAARGDAERARRETVRILEATGEGILGSDSDGRTTFVNPAAERMLGWAAGDLIGRRQHELIHHTRSDGSPYPVNECPLFRARETGDSAHVEGELFWRKDGTSCPVEYEVMPISEGDVPIGAVLSFRDATSRIQAAAERERLLREAESAREEAEHANLSKAQFLANMSHELRTPLNAIGGYAELMEIGINGPVTPEQLVSLDRIRRSQRHLLGLINGVLDYAKVDAGAVHYEIESVALDEILTTCQALTAPQVREKGLDFRHNRCDPRLAARADREKVQQITLNLLSNAVKFTDRGGRITLECSAASTEHIVIHVADTGHGIAAEKLQSAFEPFVQVDANLTRTKEGTGLGLAISRDLAHGMNGDLTAESTLGVGSTFTLTLPRAEMAS